MNIQKIVYRTAFTIGIILFIFGMFDLTPTKFGYYSQLMMDGLVLVGFGYLCMGIYYLPTRIKEMDRIK